MPQKIIEYINDLKQKDNRGALAKLRNALADSQQRQMPAWHILARFGGLQSDNHKAEVIRTVAGLLALPNITHNENTGNFGKACTSMLSPEERKSLYNTSTLGPVTRRFQQLLTSNRDEICSRVNSIGRRLNSSKTEIDIIKLYSDLTYWSDKTKTQWASDFWSIPEQKGIE